MQHQAAGRPVYMQIHAAEHLVLPKDRDQSSAPAGPGEKRGVPIQQKDTNVEVGRSVGWLVDGALLGTLNSMPFTFLRNRGRQKIPKEVVPMEEIRPGPCSTRVWRPAR